MLCETIATAWCFLRLQMEERWPPDMEGNCGYTEQAVVDSWQGDNPPAWGLSKGLTISQHKKPVCYKSYTASKNCQALMNRVMNLQVPWKVLMLGRLMMTMIMKT